MARKNLSSLIGPKSLTAFVLLVCILSCAPLAFLYLSFTNTFLNNGNWLPEKAVAVREPDSAAIQLLLRSALFKERLNPHFYFGNAAVSYKDKIAPTNLTFDLRLALGSWLCVTLSQNGETTTGIRLSANEHHKNMFFTADKDGRFTDKKLFGPQSNFDWDKDIKIGIAFDTDKTQVLADGKVIATDEPGIRHDEKYVFAFSCGQNAVNIDNASITTADKTVTDDFSRMGLLAPVSGICLLLLFGATAALFVLLRRLHLTKTKSLTLIARYHSVFFVCILTLIVTDRIMGPLEPAGMFLPMSRQKLEKIFLRFKDTKSRLHDIYTYNMPVRDKYSLPYIIKQAKDDLSSNGAGKKILFLGDSQIWGWNAGDINDNLVNRTQRLLNTRGVKVKCINGGLPGKTAKQIAEIHEQHWAGLKPDICIINIRNNDIDSFMEKGFPGPEEFGRDIEKIITTNKDNGIYSIVIMEAIEKTFPDAGDDFEEFKTRTRTVAQKHNCPLWNLHEHMIEKSDSGFVWEDSIHLSPYGTETASIFIADRIGEILRTNQALASIE